MCSPEAIIASIKKEEVQDRCRDLGALTTGSLAQMVKAIADAQVVRAQPLPLQFISLNHMITGSEAFNSTQGPSTRACWLCGCNGQRVGLENVADFQVGSWPPGDPRRWQLGGSCVIPVAVCEGYCEPVPAATAAPASDCETPPNRGTVEDEEDATLELRARLYRKSTRRTPCKVGDFPTVSAIFWKGQWFVVCICVCV